MTKLNFRNFSKNPYFVIKYFSDFQNKNNKCKNKKSRLDKA